MPSACAATYDVVVAVSRHGRDTAGQEVASGGGAGPYHPRRDRGAYSYGTDLGLTYLRRHPEGVRSLAIDSVVPPQTVSLPWAWDSAQEGINAIFAACEAQPACRSRYPDLSRTLTEQVRRLEANPLTLTVPPPGGGTPVEVVLDGGTLVNLLVANGRLVPSADVPAALQIGRASCRERVL